MVLRTLNVAIPEDSAAKLAELARAEFRAPRQQASVLLIEAIERTSRHVGRRPQSSQGTPTEPAR